MPMRSGAAFLKISSLFEEICNSSAIEELLDKISFLN
jgi:hypothetical protein